jgi:hypothetical protein
MDIDNVPPRTAPEEAAWRASRERQTSSDNPMHWEQNQEQAHMGVLAQSVPNNRLHLTPGSAVGQWQKRRCPAPRCR